MDKIFPIDIDRAFKSDARGSRPHIKKFWDTGVVCRRKCWADQDVVLGSIWNGRLQGIADKGAPIADRSWNQNMLAVIEAIGIFKACARNMKEAQLYVDYAMQAKAQARHRRKN